MTVRVCRHCQDPTRTINRPRGLCWRCYYLPGVRDLYGSTSKYAKRGVGNITGGTAPPAEPTDAMPGTPEKIEVLHDRAKAGVCLWHPLDVVIPLGVRPAAGDADPFEPLVLDLVECDR